MRNAIVRCGAIWTGLIALAGAVAGTEIPELPSESGGVDPPAIFGPPFETPPLAVGVITFSAAAGDAKVVGETGARGIEVAKIFEGNDPLRAVELPVVGGSMTEIAARLPSFAAIVLLSEPADAAGKASLRELEGPLLEAVRNGTGLLIADRGWRAMADLPALREALAAKPIEQTKPANADPNRKKTPLDDLGATLLALKVEDRFHAAARAMNSPWMLDGSLVALGPGESSATVQILMRPDVANVDLSSLSLANAEAAKRAAVWATRVGKGAVLCSGIAAGGEAAEDEYFAEHLKGALRWSAGLHDSLPAHPCCPEPAWQTLDSGLRVFDVKVGDGPVPAMRYAVKLHLHARLADGRVLKDSRWDGAPVSFTIGMFEVMEGLEAAVMTMQPGGRRIALVPPEMQGRASFPGKAVPRNTAVRLDIELLSTR
ncbi:MAG: FKBP-type peptidyl-prolyl cis-trans isomerase [Phycisphaerae bacterium]|nr:FKBP-type peptidyl-prolyl cis-trans isomerase [Phycisphaerae bacterium]